MSFKWRRRLVRFNRAQMDPARTVAVYLPRFNLGCFGIRVGTWYGDIFTSPRLGIFVNTPIIRGWFWPRSFMWRTMR